MPKVFKGRLVLPKKEARDGWYSRGYFPHFDGAGVTQHVSFHLFDSLPQSVLARWREELRMLEQKEADVEWRRRIQDFLDTGYGSCFLRDDRLAEIIENNPVKAGLCEKPEDWRWSSARRRRGTHASGVLML